MPIRSPVAPDPAGADGGEEASEDEYEEIEVEVYEEVWEEVPEDAVLSDDGGVDECRDAPEVAVDPPGSPEVEGYAEERVSACAPEDQKSCMIPLASTSYDVGLYSSLCSDGSSIKSASLTVQESEGIAPRLLTGKDDSLSLNATVHSLNPELGDATDKEPLTVNDTGNSQSFNESGALCLQASKRPRGSISPGEAVENINKKATAVCKLCDSGSCTRKNCGLHHQKVESADAIQNAERIIDDSAPNKGVDGNDFAKIENCGRKNDLARNKGVDGYTDSLVGAKLSNLEMQRMLIRAYGEDSRMAMQHVHAGTPYSSKMFEEMCLTSNLESRSDRYALMSYDERRFLPDSLSGYNYYNSVHSQLPPCQYLQKHFSSADAISGPHDSRRLFPFSRSEEGHVYYNSRSYSLPRSCLPAYERYDGESTYQERLLSSSLQKRPNNTWETSTPFVPSCNLPMSNFSSRNHCEPSTDCIKTPNIGSVSPHQLSPRTLSQNVLSQKTGSDSQLGDCTPEYGFSHSKESTSDCKMPVKGPSQTATFLSPDGVQDTMLSETRISYENNDACNSNPRLEHAQARRCPNEEDTKVVKIFRASLVEFVKELLKPFWKEGRISKDAHKIIVKKAVDKVVDSLQPHQVPGTFELIEQYKTTSHFKMLKLVEAYVHKYQNP